MLYSLDTSGLLDGWVRYYPPKTFPKLWRNMETLIGKGLLKATDEVFTELSKQGDDEVVKWCKAQSGLFIPFDAAIQIKVSEILSSFPNLVDAGKGRSGADPFVIALAELNDCAVVTGETASGKPNKPRIPDVCRGRAVRSCSFLEMIQEQGWQF